MIMTLYVPVITYRVIIQDVDCFHHGTHDNHNTTFIRILPNDSFFSITPSRTHLYTFLQVSLGTVKQCEMALSRITASLSFFIHEYKQLASYRAQVDRLYDFRCCGLAFMKDCDPEDIGGHCGHAMKHT